MSSASRFSRKVPKCVSVDEDQQEDQENANLEFKHAFLLFRDQTKATLRGAKRTLIEFDNIWPKKESTSAIKMKEPEGKEGENKIILIVLIVIVSNYFLNRMKLSISL